MFGLRKHDHCKVCGKPIPKGYEAMVRGDLYEIAIAVGVETISRSFYTRAARYRGVCDECARGALKQDIVSSVRKSENDHRIERTHLGNRIGKLTADIDKQAVEIERLTDLGKKRRR